MPESKVKEVPPSELKDSHSLERFIGIYAYGFKLGIEVVTYFFVIWFLIQHW